MGKGGITTKEEAVSEPEVLADDERGVIEKLAEGEYQSVLRITSKKGSVRANHYHQRDSHLCYLESGRLRYVYRPVRRVQDRPADDESAPLKEKIVEAGQLFYTPPMEAHAMEFLEDSVFYAFTTQSREQQQYEDDVVRIKLV